MEYSLRFGGTRDVPSTKQSRFQFNPERVERARSRFVCNSGYQSMVEARFVNPVGSPVELCICSFVKVSEPERSMPK